MHEPYSPFGPPPATSGIDRSRFLAELQQNPALVARMAAMVRGEVGLGRDPVRERIQLESAFNRAMARNHSLGQALLSVGDDPRRGYYARDTYRREATPQQMDYFQKNVLQPVLAGSDEGTKFLGSPVTGNASQMGFAGRRLANGTYANGKWYGSPGGANEMFVTEKADAARLARNPLPMLNGERVQMAGGPPLGGAPSPFPSPDTVQLPGEPKPAPPAMQPSSGPFNNSAFNPDDIEAATGAPPYNPQHAMSWGPEQNNSPLLGNAPTPPAWPQMAQYQPDAMPLFSPSMPSAPAPVQMAAAPTPSPAPMGGGGEMPALGGGSPFGGLGSVLGFGGGGGGGGSSAPTLPPAQPQQASGLDPMILAWLTQPGPFKFPSFG
jgi:hypothetical protein